MQEFPLSLVVTQNIAAGAPKFIHKEANMSAIPDDFLQRTAELSAESIKPMDGSTKVYVQGSRPDIQVPMREIHLEDTAASFGAEKNPPIPVYDTSGPYTDPAVKIDLLKGLPDVRSAWIEQRDNTELLAGPSSEYGQQRHSDPRWRICASSICVRHAVPGEAITSPRCTSPNAASSPRKWNTSPSAKA